MALLSSDNYFSAIPFSLRMPPQLRGNRQQRGEAHQHVPRLAGLQLREEYRSHNDERHDQQNSGICAPEPRCCKTHCNIENIQQREPESNFELGGIVVVTFSERPEAAGKTQQRNSWRETPLRRPLE